MNYTQLTEEERYQIYILKKEKYSPSEIARILERHPSTIGRELARNKGLKGYRPKQAQQLSDQRRRNAYKKIKMTNEVKDLAITLLKKDLSPEQVCLYLKKERKISLHHETIYQFIYQDKACGGELYKHLRIVPKPYRKRYGSYDRRGRIQGAVSIDERPKIVEKKARLGDWEGDTIIGKGRKSALLTLVERKSLYTIIVKIKGKHAEPLADALIDYVRNENILLHTLTVDNGLEFAAHQRIADELEIDVYFAHAYASWERGINENTNGLIRQYFPKGTDFDKISDEEIQMVMDKLNHRPRKTRGGKSPNEIFLGQSIDLLAA